MIRLQGGISARLLFAGPGEDSQVTSTADLINSDFVAHGKWQQMGVTTDPMLTVRNGLQALVCDPLVFDYAEEALEKVGIGALFSLAVMQAYEGELVTYLVPAMLDYFMLKTSGQIFGRVDFALLGSERKMLVQAHG